MVKIEKTGTSTLFALLSRFVRSNQLNLLIPSPSEWVHVDWQKPGLGWNSHTTLTFVDKNLIMIVEGLKTCKIYI